MDPREDKRLQLAMLYEEAQSRRQQGNPSGALIRLHRCLDLAAELADTAWQAQVETDVGSIHQEQYELPRALEWYGRALATWDSLEDHPATGAVVHRLGQVYQLQGDLKTAASYFEQALERLRRTDDRRAEALVLASQGQALCEAGRADEGLSLLVRSLAMLLGIGAPEAATVRAQIDCLRPGFSPDRFAALVQSATDDPRARAALLM